MEVRMSLDQATFHTQQTSQLKLQHVIFKIKPDMEEQKRLFRPSLYKVTVVAEVNGQEYEFAGYTLDHQLISQLEKDPSTFLIGAEPPFLSGTNWPDSAIADVVQTHTIPLDSLIITDGENVIATISNEEIPELIGWFNLLLT